MLLVINGQTRTLDEINKTSTVADLIAALGMQAERVAVERNGEIVSRSTWASTTVMEGDRLEIVQFVGGGL